VKRLWIIFGIAQASGAILATVGSVLLGIGAGMLGAVLLFPGYLVAYAFLRKIQDAPWVPIVAFLIIVPVNAAFWFAYSGRARLWKSN
jgi:hypothetical protein